MTLLHPGIRLKRTEKCLRVYVSYLSMGFLDTGNKKTSRTTLARASSAAPKRRRLCYFSQIDCLPPVFGARISTERLPCVACGTDLNSSSQDIHQQHELFFGYLSFFLRKVRVSRFTRKPFGLKNVFKTPPWI